MRTPPTSAAILAGITRDTTIQLLREQGVEVREEPIARDELYTADEVFLTGTAAEITPVRDIDHRKIGRGEAGPVTRRLQESFFSVVKGNDAKHDHWLSYYDSPRVGVVAVAGAQEARRRVRRVRRRDKLATCEAPEVARRSAAQAIKDALKSSTTRAADAPGLSTDAHVQAQNTPSSTVHETP